MSFRELANAVEGQIASEKSDDAMFSGVSIDSRTIKQGELFICIRGEINDGHKFIEQAVEKGAMGVMVDDKFTNSNLFVTKTHLVIVKNTHKAMNRLAQSYRKKVGAKIMGITGSNGKTTTKEFAYALLNAVEPDSYRSPGNLNNLYGAPLALFAMPQNTKAAVIEMGISTTGEMSQLTEIVEPNVAVITNVGPSHLEFLSTVEDVALAKLEIVSESNTEVPLIINADDKVLVREAEKIRKDVVTFGIKNKADFMPEVIKQTEKGSMVLIEGSDFLVNLFGQHHVYNLLAAFAACRTLGYSFSKVDTAKIELNPSPMRGEVINKDGLTIINDSYNANPESVRAGIEGFKNSPLKGRRVLILGDMLELGERSEKFHRELGQFLSKQKFSLAIVIGVWSSSVLNAAKLEGVEDEKIWNFRNVDEAAKELKELIKSGDVIYVKGSRGVGLDKLIEKIGTGGGAN